MKLYHGSPKKLKILKPSKAKGVEEFENQKAIFLCKTFNHAALYSIGKNLKGKTSFMVFPNKLVIVGEHKLKQGYVYEVNVRAKKEKRNQYSCSKEINKFKIKQVKPKDFIKQIIFIKNKKELDKLLK